MYTLEAKLTFLELDTLFDCIYNERQKLLEAKLKYLYAGKHDHLKIIDNHIQFLDDLKIKLKFKKDEIG